MKRFMLLFCIFVFSLTTISAQSKGPTIECGDTRNIGVMNSLNCMDYAENGHVFARFTNMESGASGVATVGVCIPDTEGCYDTYGPVTLNGYGKWVQVDYYQAVSGKLYALSGWYHSISSGGPEINSKIE